MTTSTGKRAEEVFLAIVDLPREAWDGALKAQCAGDSALEANVRGLLGFHDRADGFLEKPEFLTQGIPLLRRDDRDETLASGTRVGEYTIEGLLGTGGMGSVYIARQDRPSRTVALKVIRRGLATTSLIRRFEHEAEMLGRLQHVGIAQIYEAGAASLRPGEFPQPYIAMELVRGLPLHTHAERNGLSASEKLAQMAKVCDAVHHAHQRGVIHRDLKPGNILIDEAGQPKILDFGVARAADADLRVTTLQTSVGQLIGTLPYMSPEQVLADPREVDTRSDVYALGVILYQLLTGRLPLDVASRSIPEAARVIREEAPSRLSAVSKVFRGDIETIVSKAMDKDKSRRYQSAAELGDDLRRHLQGLPIQAKQDSAVYVILKQLRRHRLVAAVAAALLLSLVGFAVYATVQAGRFSRMAVRERAAMRTAQDASVKAEAAASQATEKAAELREQLHATSIERGRLEGLAGNVAFAEDALWKAYFAKPTELRARWALWEMYERSPCERTLQVFPGMNAGNGGGLAFSGDRSLVACVGQAGEVAVYAMDTMQPVCRWKTGVGVCDEIRFRDGAKGLVLLGRQGLVEQYSLATDEQGRTSAYLAGSTDLRVRRGLERAVLSADGRWAAAYYGAAGGTVVMVHNLESQGAATTLPAPGDRAYSLAIAPNGAKVGLGTIQGEVLVWDVAGRVLERRVRHGVGYVAGITFSNDLRRLTSGGRDRRVVVTDLFTGEKLSEVNPELESTRHVEETPDGAMLVSAGRASICVWEAATLRPIATLAGHRVPTLNAAWSADGTRLATLGFDGVLKVWAPVPHLATHQYEGNSTWAFDFDISPDGKHLACAGGDGKVHVWTIDGTPVAERDFKVGRFRSVRYSADGTRLFAAGNDGVVRVMRVPGYEDVASFEGPIKGSELSVMALSPDGKTIAVGCFGGRTALYRTDTYELVSPLVQGRGNETNNAAVFSKDGQKLYSNGVGRNIAVWDIASRKLEETWPLPASNYSLAMSPAGDCLAAGLGSGKIQLINPGTGTVRRELDAHLAGIYALGFSPSGALLASGGDDGRLKVWDVSSGQLLVTLYVRKGEVPSVGFSRDGHLLVATFQDRVVLSWDLLRVSKFIAGNAEYQWSRLEGELDPTVDVTPAMIWSRRMLAPDMAGH